MKELKYSKIANSQVDGTQIISVNDVNVQITRKYPMRLGINSNTSEGVVVIVIAVVIVAVIALVIFLNYTLTWRSTKVCNQGTISVQCRNVVRSSTVAEC